jgi:oligopeptide/dipeptide ABC transporter ATP-binding protein
MLAIAGYGLVGLFVVLLGVVIGARSADQVVLPVAVVSIAAAVVLYGIVRLTRNRQWWSLALAVGVDVLLALLFIYLIVTLQFASDDANAIFFAQLAITPALVFAVASAWHFLRGAKWFNGEHERPLRAEDSGARPISAPLIAGGPTESVHAGPDLAAYGTRLGAYLIDAVAIGVVSALAFLAGQAIGSGTTAVVIGLAVGALVSIGYFPYFWTNGGRTPGMRITRVKVVRETGAPGLTWGTSFRRYVVFVFGAAALFIGWLWVFVDPRRKAWHDIAAQTIVVEEGHPAPSTATTATTAATDAPVAAANAPAVSDAVAAPAAVEADPLSEADTAIVEGVVAEEAAQPGHIVKGQPLLVVQGLKKHFPIYGGVLRRQIGTVYAVDGVDFEIMPGETFSLVGESGCGKTTLGRTVIQLTPSTDGRVVFDGYELADVDPEDMRPLRRRMQIIFQDPFGSLNPRMPISDIIGEGLLAQGLSNRAIRDKRTEDALELVGLRREYTRRYPHEFSGGQRQRIGVARALALGPDFIVADEPVSALDVSIQSQVLNLLLDLKRDLNLTYLFISHNLSVVQYFSDRVGVMYLGKIVEIGSVEQLYRNPRHPYTVALLSAIPEPDPRRRKSRLVLKGDVPSPAAPPSGCRFHTRCWLRERLGNPENCSTIEPPLRPFGELGHQVACHWADDISQTTVSEAVAETPAIVPAAIDEE